MSLMLKQYGFTLVEMVVTIVVLGVIMSGTAIYITNSTIAYNDVAQRDQLTSLGRVTVERVTRQIRNALPNSIRVSNNCIEFLPIIGSSVYLSLPTDSPASNFTAAAFTLTPANGTPYVIVYPFSQAALYAGANPGPRAQFTSVAGSPTATVTLTGTHRFVQHAPHRRFYIVDSPTSLCVVGTNLVRYRGYAISAAQNAPPSATAELLAENIQINDGGAVTPFAYTPGTLRRNGIVAMDFRFLIDGEWIRLFHEVQVRNVL